MKRLALALLVLFAPQAFAAYAFVGSEDAATTGQTAERTSLYSPTSGNSLILAVRTRLAALPLTGYSGTGTPGDGTNTYKFLGYSFGFSGNPTYTLSPVPGAGATSATLASAWSGTTGTYDVVFSDGEYRTSVTLTNGQTGFSWATGLGGTVGPIVQIDTNPNLFAIYQATGVSSTAIQGGAGSAAAEIDGVYLAEYSGIQAASTGTIGGATPNPVDLSFNFQSNPGATSNALVSGDVVITSSSMAWGLTYDWSCNATPLAGSGFTSRSMDTCSVAEDATASTTTQTTFTAGDGFDSFTSLIIAFPIGSGGGSSAGITGIFNQFPYAQWQTLTGNTTLSPGEPDVLCNASGGSFTITLPTAVNSFTTYIVKKIDTSTNTCTIATTSSQTIDGASSAVISRPGMLSVRSDNANWWIQ